MNLCKYIDIYTYDIASEKIPCPEESCRLQLSSFALRIIPPIITVKHHFYVSVTCILAINAHPIREFGAPLLRLIYWLASVKYIQSLADFLLDAILHVFGTFHDVIRLKSS